MDAYACSCGRPVEAKAQRRARKGHVWGARLDGRRGKLGGPPERRAALGVVSLRLARCGYSLPRLLEQLLGTYVFHLIFVGPPSPSRWEWRCWWLCSFLTGAFARFRFFSRASPWGA